MESVRTKSYSSIFSALNTKSEIEEDFSNGPTPILSFKGKAEIINEIYLNRTPLEKKVASVFLGNLPLLLWFLHTSLLSWKQQIGQRS